METKNCVVCGEPAISWSGHVHTSIGTIIAGRCRKHEQDSYTGKNRVSYCSSVNPSSCYGEIDINSLELYKPTTTESFRLHLNQQIFNAKIDNSYGSIGQSKPNYFRRFLNRLFN
jgi:hypothetical protein